MSTVGCSVEEAGGCMMEMMDGNYLRHVRKLIENASSDIEEEKKSKNGVFFFFSFRPREVMEYVNMYPKKKTKENNT